MGSGPEPARRDVRALPKAHLHLHFTGSMRHATLLELAERDGILLPDSLVSEWPPQLSAADEKGWFRFQRLYDVARSVLRTEDDVRRLVREAAEDDVRDGGRWLEIQVDPSGYGARFGGITAFTDLVLDAVRETTAATGLGIAVVIAANRTRHPLDARTLARLAAQYAGRGVVGFGLSNDERRGVTEEFAPAFAIAERAGLTLVPHGGELVGPASVRRCVDSLHADRLGHGVRSVEDPDLLARVVDAGYRAGDLPGLQRRAGRLLRPHVGTAAHAAGGRRHRRPGRRRPPALRVAPGRAVHHDAGGPRPVRRDPGPARGDVRPGLVRAGRGEGRPARRGRRLAVGDPGVCHHVAMSDEHPGMDETQPITGPTTGPATGPSAVPPPQNPYAAPQNPYQPPPNPYPQPGSFDQSAAPGPYGTQTYGAYPQGYGAALPDEPSATTAMVLGIVGLVGIALCGGITLVLSPFAWAIGRKSVREIDANPGRYGGRDRANAGKIMGIIGTVFLLIGIAAIVAVIGLIAAVPDSPAPIDQSPTFQNGAAHG